MLAGNPNLFYKVGAVDCRKNKREQDFCAKDLKLKLKLKLNLNLNLNLNLESNDDLPLFAIRMSELEGSPVVACLLHGAALAHTPNSLLHNIVRQEQIDELLLLSNKKQQDDDDDDDDDDDNYNNNNNNGNSNSNQKQNKPVISILTDKYDTTMPMNYQLAYQYRHDFV